MGPGIGRYFVSFRRLVNPENLASIKIVTNEMEKEFASNAKRSVNLDPGLLALSRFVLATTKDTAQRIALRDGIYAELHPALNQEGIQDLSLDLSGLLQREYMKSSRRSGDLPG
jgi:hypothetical protein